MLCIVVNSVLRDIMWWSQITAEKMTFVAKIKHNGWSSFRRYAFISSDYICGFEKKHVRIQIFSVCRLTQTYIFNTKRPTISFWEVRLRQTAHTEDLNSIVFFKYMYNQSWWRRDAEVTQTIFVFFLVFTTKVIFRQHENMVICDYKKG